MAADDPFEGRLAAGLRDLLEAEPLPHPTWSGATVAHGSTAKPGRGAVWLLAAAVIVALVGSALLVAGGRLSIPPALTGPTAVLTASPTPTAAPSASPPPSPAATCQVSTSVNPTASPASARTSLTAVSAVKVFDGSPAVVQFTAGLVPGDSISVRSVEPPFRRDPSDLPVAVAGNVFLEITLRGVEGSQLSPAALDQRLDGAFVTELVEIGDYEGVQTWVLGLADGACPSVSFVIGVTTVEVKLTDG